MTTESTNKLNEAPQESTSSLIWAPKVHPGYTASAQNEPETCGFCPKPCGNDWCVTKRRGQNKNPKSWNKGVTDE